MAAGGLLAIGHVERLVRTVTVADIDSFAAMSGDRAPLHLEDGFARSKGFSGRVAHGALLVAYLSALIGERLPGPDGVLQSLSIEFRNPLIPPSTIELSAEVVSVSPGTGQVALRLTVVGPGGVVLATGKATSVVRPPTQ